MTPARIAAGLLVLLTSACTASTSPHPPSSAPLGPALSGSAPAGPAPDVRVTARIPLPGDAEPVAIAESGGALWVARAPAGTAPGRLDKFDARTGQPQGSWPVDGHPAAIAAGPDVWLAGPGAPGDVARYGADGHLAGRYPVAGAVSAVADGADGAWVGSVTGDTAHITHLPAGAASALPGQGLGGQVPVARCPSGVYAAVLAPSGRDTIVVAIAADASPKTVATLPGYGATSLVCDDRGLLLAQQDDAVTVRRLAADGHVSATQREPSRTAVLAPAAGFDWLLLAGGTAGSTTCTLIRPDTLARAGSADLAGDTVAVAADGRRLWALQAGPPTGSGVAVVDA